ncbi:MAG TPA: HPr kinase/phosphatase C-terminal domain-containing protein [Sphingomicrobium sp.]|nr:HPr kinase/phosphatase C-terminal domain-containing protein [Sphingomicrobium sp.]
MNPRLSSETLHATTVAKDGRAILISGRSGSGKSDLALRLLDRGFVLVSDDQTYLRIAGGKLVAAAPPTIRGKLEVRGIGVVEVEQVDDVAVCLVVELAAEIDRMPDEGRERLILGATIPLVSIDAQAASAPAKVAMALDLLGLKP